MDCPVKYCNGHGICKYNSFPKLGLTVGDCECDIGYSGYDCSERTCPKSLNGFVTIDYSFTNSLTTGIVTMTNKNNNVIVYKEWAKVSDVKVGDLITELKKFGKFTYTLSSGLNSDSPITSITGGITLTLSGVYFNYFIYLD